MLLVANWNNHALKEFCEYRNLIPKGVKVTAEDVWKMPLMFFPQN